MLTLYSQQISGNCYKPRLLMALLEIPFRIVDLNTYDGSTRKPEWCGRRRGTGAIGGDTTPDGSIGAK